MIYSIVELAMNYYNTGDKGVLDISKQDLDNFNEEVKEARRVAMSLSI